jgi:phosphatidylglycerol---prolipoprotein diacylglyceryl transferase
MLGYLQFPEWVTPEIIPGLPLRWYGLMYLLAFLIAFLLFRWQIKDRELDVNKDDMMSFFFWGIIGLLIGARIFATLFFDPTHMYLKQPWLIFWPFSDGRFVGFQGMNYYGGLVGAVVALIIFCRIKKINLLDWGDMLLAGVPLGYTFGRLGNFINAELFGRVTTAPWGMIFPHARRFPVSEEWVRETAAKIGMEMPETGFINLPRHPTQLYEGFFEGVVLWLVLWFVFRKRKKFDGYIIGLYIIGYGVIRFIIDYFRMPISRGDFLFRLSPIENPPYLLLTPFNFITSQLYSFLMILGGILFFIGAKKYAERKLARAEEDQNTKKTSGRKLRKKIK